MDKEQLKAKINKVIKLAVPDVDFKAATRALLDAYGFDEATKAQYLQAPPQTATEVQMQQHAESAYMGALDQHASRMREQAAANTFDDAFTTPPTQPFSPFGTSVGKGLTGIGGGQAHPMPYKKGSGPFQPKPKPEKDASSMTVEDVVATEIKKLQKQF